MLGATYVLRHPRTGGYWFRRRVPDHLRPIIGRREITKTLGTKCLSEAKRLSRPYADATDQLFDEALGRVGDGAPSEPVAAASSPTPPEGDRAWVDEFIKARVVGGLGIMVDATTTLTDSLPAAPITPIEAPTRSAPIPPPVTPEMTTVIATSPRLRITTVQDMFERYISEFERRPRTERTWRTHLDMFLQISGLSWTTHVHTVTDAHVEDFILAMRKLPARRQDAFYRGLTLPEIIAKFGDRRDLPKLDQKTINNKVDSLRAIFYYALRHKYVAYNPFVGKTTKRVSRRTPPKKRLPFDADELRTIFTSDLFQPPSSEWGSKAWLPVIACYTGCRLEEIGQLRVSDFRVQGGIPYLAITAIDLGSEGNAHGDIGAREKALKTDTSDRNVPLHPVLRLLDLPDFVNRMRQRGESRLFPDIQSTSDEVTAAYSKWFGRYLTRVGITSPLKVFHSFRHGFKDACRNGGVPREISEVLMGHAGRTVGDTYGNGYALDVLAGEIARVNFGLPWDEHS
jgi:integrase